MLFCFLRLRTAVVTDALKTEYSYYRVCRLYGDFRFGACRMDAFLRVAFWCCLKSRQPFAEVDSCYNQFRKRASLSSSSLSIVSELKAVLPGMYRVVAVQSGVCLMMPAGVMLLREINTAVPFLWLLKQFLTRLVMQMYGLLSTIETVI